MQRQIERNNIACISILINLKGISCLLFKQFGLPRKNDVLPVASILLDKKRVLLLLASNCKRDHWGHSIYFSPFV